MNTKPEQLYEEFVQHIDGKKAIDSDKLRNLLFNQPDRNLQKKMTENLILSSRISWPDYFSFFSPAIENGEVALIRLVISHARNEFDSGGFSFLFALLTCGDSQLFELAAEAVKNSRMSPDAITAFCELLKGNKGNRHLVEFCMAEYIRELKTAWYQLVQDQDFSLDLKLKLMEHLKKAKDASYAKILEKLTGDSEPVVSSLAQRILEDLYGEYSLVREKKEKEPATERPSAIKASVLERSGQKLVILGGGAVFFFVIHVAFGTAMPPAFTYLFYWAFIVFGCSMGMEEGISVSVAVFLASFSFRIMNFTPNFSPGITLAVTYLLVGVAMSLFNRQLHTMIEELQGARKGTKNMKNRIATLEKQLNSNLEVIQSIKEKLTERTVKLYALMVNIREITSSVDIDTIGSSMAEILGKGLQAKAGQIYLVDPDQEEIYSIRNFRFEEGKIRDLPEKRMKIASDPLVEFIFRKQEILTPVDFRRYPELMSVSKNTTIETKILAPLVVDREVKALINVEKRVKDEIGEDEMLLLNAMISSATIALKNAEVFNLNREALNRLRTLGERERMKQMKLKEMFGKYVSPEVVNQMLSQSQDISLGGDTSEIAILLMDIRGFTGFAENFPPERVVELLNSFFRIASELILAFNGTIDKFMGDAILCFFGAPVPVEDPIGQAVKCAFRIQNECELLREETRKSYGFDLTIGQTINFGKAIVGNIGSDKRMEYTAIGDVVNTASRLEDLALPGQILVPDLVYSQLGNRVEAELTGDYKLRGKQKPIRVYNLKKWKEKL